ncbi:MAG TPA: hypothetical protein VK666_10380 [Chryseolinea sp.]|nr:hypothetical protein [Chryseolinea sp.]
MARPFFALLSLSLLISACTKQLICPAYQSAFIYDKNELRKKFSYFLEDSTPKMLTASKTKYLIAEPVSYRKKLRSMQTVEMKDINPVLPDSMKVGEEGLVGEDGVVPGAELDLAARSVIDSTYIVDVPRDTTSAEVDSAYMISKDKELRLLKYHYPDSAVYDETTGKYVAKNPTFEVEDVRFNVEQDNYMWYLRKNLVLPDVRLAQHMQSAESATKKKEKKGIGAFFKNLFKKKDNKNDSTELLPTKPAEEFDYVDENEDSTPATDVQTAPKEKKRIFPLFKKKDQEEGDDITAPKTDGGAPTEKSKKKKKAKKEKKPKDEAKPEDKKEDDDDGF